MSLGPSGVGKTSLAKELARFLFDTPDALLRFDMNEYHEKHTRLRLGSSKEERLATAAAATAATRH